MSEDAREFADLADRLAARLRGLPLSGLGRLVDGSPRWRHALDLARELAGLAEGAEVRAAAEPPAWRAPIPEAGPFAVADQLVVATTELLLALPTEPEAAVWTPRGRAPAGEVLARATALVEAAARRL